MRVTPGHPKEQARCDVCDAAFTWEYEAWAHVVSEHREGDV